MTENGKSNSEGLRIWLFIDTILSMIFILLSYYLWLTDFGGDAGIMILPVVFVIFCVHLALCTALIIHSWVLRKEGKFTKSIIWSIIAFGIALFPLTFALIYVLGILSSLFREHP